MTLLNCGVLTTVTLPRKVEELTSNVGLSQIINEPTDSEPNKNPSCIDLIFTVVLQHP